MTLLHKLLEWVEKAPLQPKVVILPDEDYAALEAAITHKEGPLVGFVFLHVMNTRFLSESAFNQVMYRTIRGEPLDKQFEV